MSCNCNLCTGNRKMSTTKLILQALGILKGSDPKVVAQIADDADAAAKAMSGDPGQQVWANGPANERTATNEREPEPNRRPHRDVQDQWSYPNDRPRNVGAGEKTESSGRGAADLSRRMSVPAKQNSLQESADELAAMIEDIRFFREDIHAMKALMVGLVQLMAAHGTGTATPEEVRKHLAGAVKAESDAEDEDDEEREEREAAEEAEKTKKALDGRGVFQSSIAGLLNAIGRDNRGPRQSQLRSAPVVLKAGGASPLAKAAMMLDDLQLGTADAIQAQVLLQRATAVAAGVGNPQDFSAALAHASQKVRNAFEGLAA